MWWQEKSCPVHRWVPVLMRPKGRNGKSNQSIKSNQMETIINDFVSASLGLKTILVFYGVCVISFYGSVLYGAVLFASDVLTKAKKSMV